MSITDLINLKTDLSFQQKPNQVLYCTVSAANKIASWLAASLILGYDMEKLSTWMLTPL